MAGTVKGSAGIVTIAGQTLGEIRSFTIEETADTIEDTSMGDTHKSYKDSLKGFTASIDALFDEDDVGQAEFTIGASVACVFRSEGEGSGLMERSGTGIVTGISINQSYDGLVETSFTLQGTGELSITAQS
jgi:predicted secreted protein